MIKNPVKWPNGKRCAVAITFDIDSDSILHLAHPNTAETRVATTSWLQYDQIAIPRILDMYKRFNLKQTFFVPAWVIEQYPKMIEQIVNEGHEIAAHGYLHEHPNQQSREDELYWLQKSIEIIENFTGKRPRGWRAPMYDFSKYSAELLAKENFIYDSSLMGDDVPYILNTVNGSIIELPTDWSMDDWPQYTHNLDLAYQMPINSPDRAMEVYLANFDAVWEYGGLWVSVWHPFVSGRLARCHRVSKMIEYMNEKGDVWFATLEEIALHVKKCIDDGNYIPREDTLPYYDGCIEELQVKSRINL